MTIIQAFLLNKYLLILVLAVVAFVQNMAFTASSRSRNSGNPFYHLKIAIASNGIWFICHLLVWSQIWNAVAAFRLTGDYVSAGLWLALVAIVYVISTSAGSSYMMVLMLKRENGNKRVGALRDDAPTVEVRTFGEPQHGTTKLADCSGCEDPTCENYCEPHILEETLEKRSSYAWDKGTLILVCAECNKRSAIGGLDEECSFVKCPSCGYIHSLK